MLFRVLWLFMVKGHHFVWKRGEGKALIIFVLLLWYSTSGFLYFELPGKPDLNWLDALWWSMVTMATVGYGDIFPITPAGRYLVGVPTMVFGIGFLGYLISQIAGALIESRSKRIKGMIEMTASEHILIVNFSHLDMMLKLVRELHSDSSTREKAICLVDETLEEIPQELMERGVHFVKGDPTRKEVLNRAGVTRASHAIILSKDPGDPHSDDQNLATTLVMESMNDKIFSVVEIVNAEKINQVELAGANSVICASELSSGLIIQEMQDPGVKNIIKDLVSDLGGHQIYFVPVPKLANREYAELVQWGLSNRYSIIGIVRDGVQMLNCPSSEKIRETDSAVVIGSERPEEISI